jgi:hypothetical protein
MIGVRARLACAMLLPLLSGCVTTNHYVKKNRGAPEYEIRIVNNCSPATAVLYLDDEYRNRRKIDVKARRIAANSPRTFRIPGGPHTYHVEFNELNGIRVREGSFVVEAAATYRMC